MKTSSLETRILLAALPDVAFDGWTATVFSRAAGKAAADPAAARRAFPRGAADLALYFPAWADARMLERLSPAALRDMRVRDRVALAVRTRLEILAPHRQAVAAGLRRLPPRHVWATADAIWRIAGDTATDWNHYTKRLILSGVITATTLYWLNDASDGHEKTWAFLDRRMDDALALGRGIGRLRARGA